MTSSYLGIFDASICVNHWPVSLGTKNNHGNQTLTYPDQPIARKIITFYPLHRLPHHDIVSADYMARVMIDFVMEVPDASVYKKNDRVEILPSGGEANYAGNIFLVQGFPFNWSDSNPFGFDVSMVGGSVHVEKVS